MTSPVLANTSSFLSDNGGILGATLAVFTILGLISRRLHLPELLHGIRLFLLDWNGQPARKGVDAIPSFPERLRVVEQRSATLVAVGEGVVRIEQQTGENHAALGRVDFRLNGIDQRITDHSERNKETVEVLRQDLERRADDLDQRLQAQAAELAQALADRNASVDARLARLSEDLMRAETMRAALAELGIPVAPPDPPEST